MQTKTIDKLEDLKGYEWEYKNAEFILESTRDGILSLRQKNAIYTDSKMGVVAWKAISLCNLTELEFYGLKVVLSEKPKLTRKERDFLEIHDIETYIARDESGLLVIGNTEPIQENDYWEWEENKLYLGESTFNFITWESGKAWSRAELMELEVVE